MIEIGDAAAAGHCRVDRGPNQHLGMGTAAAWRNVALHAVGKEEHADAIGILDGRKREDSRQLRRDVALAPVDGTEGHGAGDVDDHQHREIALLDELLHVREPGAGRDVPIDGADVVARLIFTDLRELDPTTMECGVVIAGEPGTDQARADNLQLTHPTAERHELFLRQSTVGADEAVLF